MVTMGLVIAWIIFRWGAMLLTLYALARLYAGEWGEAVLALLVAFWLDLSRASASWIDWNVHGRDVWLKQRSPGRRRW
jgi:hypothetical protein